MKALLVILTAVAACVLLTACNTMEGLGKDTKKLGEKIEEKAAR
ncbi:MAG TPA: entericidin A/B family lipoprotein [Phycisphaerales bacterium]|nr:entericidin A/B family lipoprotein [Phycisphaerales bacterium]